LAEEQWFEAKVLAKAGHPVVSKKFKAVAEVVQRDLEIKVAADKTKRGSNNDYINSIKTYACVPEICPAMLLRAADLRGGTDSSARMPH
jgi:hypothetical protein